MPLISLLSTLMSYGVLRQKKLQADVRAILTQKSRGVDSDTYYLLHLQDFEFMPWSYSYREAHPTTTANIGVILSVYCVVQDGLA